MEKTIVKKTVTFFLAILILMGLTVCATGETKAAEYPGEMVRAASWRETVQDGYLLGIRAIIWEAVELDQDYLHPANSELGKDYIIERQEGYNGESAWAIPFAVFPTNETRGFGSFESYISVGLTWLLFGTRTSGMVTGIGGSGSLYSGAMYAGREDNALREEAAYFMTVICNSNGIQKAESTGYPMKVQQTLGEAETGGWAGYVYFIDGRKTPANPNGLTTEELGVVYFAIGSQLSASSWPKDDRAKNVAHMFVGQYIATVTIDKDGKLLVQGNPDWQLALGRFVRTHIRPSQYSGASPASTIPADCGCIFSHSSKAYCLYLWPR